jgi:hypothetical protein
MNKRGSKSGAAVHETASLEQRFSRLVSEWRGGTRYSSSTTEIAMHPAYQQIIGMGRAALPLIMKELRTKPDHWFWALKAITGVDPVSSEDRGNIKRMAHAWLDWAATQDDCQPE